MFEAVVVAFGDDGRFAESPAEVRIAQLGAAQALDFAGAGDRAFDQATWMAPLGPRAWNGRGREGGCVDWSVKLDEHVIEVGWHRSETIGGMDFGPRNSSCSIRWPQTPRITGIGLGRRVLGPRLHPGVRRGLVGFDR